MKKNYYFKKYLDWSWTTPAVNNYLNSFSKFNAFNIDIDTQEYVGVYGPTQVGKTTFILTLIGINTEYINDLSMALRGKQLKGQSSTVTATLYKKIDGENFEIVLPNNCIRKCKNLHELESELKQFREEVTSSNYYNLSEMIIKIPRKYFDEEKSRNKSITIIDLPGDDTADEGEEDHVNKILKKYLLICRTILIMEMGHQVNQLSQLDIEVVKNWMKYPDRFIIVLTRALTNLSIKTLLRNNKLRSDVDIIKFYLEALESSYSNNTKISNIVTFFELGDSLEDIRKREKEIYLNALNWNNINFDTILNKIYENNSPEFRLKNLKNIVVSIEELKKKELDKLQSEIENIQKNIDIKKKIVEKTSKILNVKEDERAKLSEKWNSIYGIISDKKFENIFQEKLDIWKELSGKDKFFVLENRANTLIAELSNFLKVIARKLKQYYELGSYTEIEKKFKDLVRYLERYDFSIEKNIFGNSRNDDFYYEMNFLFKEVMALYDKFTREVDLMKKRELKVFDALIKKLVTEKHAYDQKINGLTQIFLELQSKIRVAENEWKEELKKVGLFEDILMEEYSKQTQILANKIKGEESSRNKMLIFLIMRIITNQVERVLKIYDRERGNIKVAE